MRILALSVATLALLSTPAFAQQELAQRAAAAMATARQAVGGYSYTQDVRVEEIGFGQRVMGDYHRIAEVRGGGERIIYFPVPTLTGEPPIQVLGDGFVGVEDLAEGTYAGRERIDEIETAKFTTPSGATVWVDTVSGGVVKASAQVAGLPCQTFNEQVGGAWFPTYRMCDGQVETQRLRVIVKFSAYRAG